MRGIKKGRREGGVSSYVFHFVLFVSVFFVMIGGALFLLHVASAFPG